MGSFIVIGGWLKGTILFHKVNPKEKKIWKNYLTGYCEGFVKPSLKGDQVSYLGHTLSFHLRKEIVHGILIVEEIVDEAKHK